MVKNILIAFSGLVAAVMVSFFQQWAMGFFIDKIDQPIVCNASISWDILIINRVCLENDMYPSLDPEQVLQLVRNKIDTIDKVYNIDQASIDFHGSILSSSSIKSLDFYKALYMKKSWVSTIIEWFTSPEIHMPLETIAMEQLRNYGIVAVDRDISDYGNCATQNFMVGMKAMEHIVIEPGTTRNANKTFAHLPGYCTGSSTQEYMFYQWICGVSSMAFRASMLDPDVTILKRSGHTKWFTKYYGDTIYGDDAAIYENIKQFEMRNDSDYPLYIKSKIIWDRPYLVFISPRPLSSKVQLKKEQTGPLSARIERNFMRDGKIITEFWNSEYAVKTEEGN
jgi:VanW like protein